jgi:hypothetical protein
MRDATHLEPRAGGGNIEHVVESPGTDHGDVFGRNALEREVDIIVGKLLEPVGIGSKVEEWARTR